MFNKGIRSQPQISPAILDITDFQPQQLNIYDRSGDRTSDPKLNSTPIIQLRHRLIEITMFALLIICRGYSEPLLANRPWYFADLSKVNIGSIYGQRCELNPGRRVPIPYQ